MDDLKFNIYAMSNPQTAEDLIALLEEALVTLEYMSEVFDKITEMTAK